MSGTGAPGAAPRVLLIDDHEFFRTCLRALLESAGFDVVASCPTVAEGLRAVPEAAPEVVLIDLDMPEVDGVQGTGLIQARWPRLPVLMLTGTPNTNRHRAALQAGCRRVLTKDDPADLLVAALHEALGQLQAHSA